VKIYDITRTITASLAVWPGDTPYSHRWAMRIQDGDPVNVSTLTMSAHTGTHADAHYHYDESGLRLDAMPLDVYLGPATVIELDVRGAILPGHLAHVDLTSIERLLLKTHASHRPDDQWEEDFPYLAPATARLLVQSGVRLLGTDAPSVDPQSSKTMEAHLALNQGPIAILETLQLRDVPPGEYELIALPLKIPIDGSPVRAVLRSL
jgi:arylformamidase